MKKDFSKISTGAALQQLQTAQGTQAELEELEESKEQDVQLVQDVQDNSNKPKKRKPRKRYSEEEAREILESGRNARGLGGVSMPRINMSFSPANHDFIYTMSRVRGQTITYFVNEMLDLYREKYKEQYEKARAFINSLDGEN